MSLGISIKPDHWQNQAIIKKYEKLYPYEFGYFKDLKNSIEKAVEVEMNNILKTNVIPEPAELREKIKAVVFPKSKAAKVSEQKKNSTQTPLFDLLDQLINDKAHYSPGTLKTFQTSKKHLEAFNKKASFESITLKFYKEYVSFLKKEGLSEGSIGKEIKNLKIVMSRAAEEDLTENFAFKLKAFKVFRPKVKSVHLDEKDILKLYKTDLKNTDGLEPIRDLFVFGCCVGLRYSDLVNIKKENFIKDEDGATYLKMLTQKTKIEIAVPLNDLALKIMEKYKHKPNSLPDAVTNQYFNRALKTIGKLASLDEKGRLSTEIGTELYKLIKTHTARRSFTSNILDRGVSSYDAMKMTGHTSERIFIDYDKNNPIKAAKRAKEKMISMLPENKSKLKAV